MSRLIATFFYVGHMRPAPGTWGSFAALIVGWFIAVTLGATALLVASALAFGVGYWATQKYTFGKEDHDPSEVVIDEVVGQWLALWPVAVVAPVMSPVSLALCTLAFALFRLFDIWKPGLVGWADRQDGALGVMLDDVIAGVMAGLVMAVLVFGTL